MQAMKTVLDMQAKIGLTDHLGSVSATDELVKLCHILPGYKILDVGCGAGRTPLYLAKMYETRVVGVDVHPVMVAHANKILRRENMEDWVSFRQADALDLPFADNTFDVVIGENVTSFAQDIQQAVNEYVRVTKPGGFVGINEATYLRPDPSEEIQSWVVQEITASAQICTPEIWKTFLTNAGLRDVFGKVYPFDLKAQTFLTIKRYGLPDFLRIWSRSLRLYLSHSENRLMFRTWAEKIPEDLPDYFGYGLYTGRKPDGLRKGSIR